MRRAIAAVMACAAALLALVLAGSASAATCPGQCQTLTGSPLVVKASADTGIQVFFGGETQGQVFPPSNDRGNAGTYVAVDGQLFGPGSYTELSQSAVSGAGAPASPFTVVTVVGLGGSGLRMTETVSMVNGEPFFRIDRRLDSTATSPKAVSVFHYADLFLRGSDTGFGYFDPATGSIGGQTPAGDFFQIFTPITPASHYQEGRFSEVLGRIQGVATGGPPLADSLLAPPDPANNVDNGAALQWDLQVPAGGSQTVSDFWSFGTTPQVPGARPPAPPLPPAPDLQRTIPAPQTLRAGPTRARVPGRISLRSLRRSKCVLVLVETRRPARILVTLFSGRRSTRLFGQKLVRFNRPGQRTVCIQVPLRARTFNLRTFLRASLGYKLGPTARRGEPSPRPVIRPIRLVP